MKKLFMAIMAIATIAMVSCKPKEVNPPTPGPGPTPDPDPVVTTPELDGISGSILVAAYIPDGICKAVYMEGEYEGWNIDPTVATELKPLADYANWYTAEIKIPAGTEDVTAYMGHCKILLTDEAGAIPGDWSSQWNSDKVTIAEGSPAELVDDQGQKALSFTADAVGAVVYLTIAGWQNKPCANYGVAAAAKIKAANIIVYNAEEDKNMDWQWADMKAEGNGVFTYELEVVSVDNLGCNIGYQDGEDLVEAWYPFDNTEAGIKEGDKIKYTFTSENGPKGKVEVKKL